MQAPERVVRVMLVEKKKDHVETLMSNYSCQHIKVSVLSTTELLQLVGKGAVHQGVVAECKAQKVFGENDWEHLLAKHEVPIVLVLDQVQDPHNLGACLRTANAMGVCCVVVPKDKSAGITSVVEKVSCGATVLTPLVTVVNLARTLKKLRASGLWLVALDMVSEQTLDRIDLTGPIAVVMGGEGRGIRDLTRKHCDYIAKIPMQGSVSSLNVSVATGMTLYEVNRQRGG